MEFNSASSQGFYSSSGGSDGIYLLRGSGILVEGIVLTAVLPNQTVFVGLYNEEGGMC